MIQVQLILFGVFLLVLLGLNVAMFISLGRQGDERRKMIIEKAGANTFMVMAVYLLFCIAENAVQVLMQGGAVKGMNPFITLSVMAMIYSVQLLYFKKRYEIGRAHV